VNWEAAGLEGRVERELAGQVSNWQQLQIAKKALLAGERVEPEDCRGLTRSQRLLWYRNNQDKIQLDNYRCQNSSNYRQLQLARGQRTVVETEEEREARDRTKSEALCWYRYGGGEEELERQKAMVGMCSTWQQYQLMSRGGTAREQGERATRSEALLWYRQGGWAQVEARDQLARDSSNWRQFQMNRDTMKVSLDLEQNMNTRWSEFKSKQELSDYIAEMRKEGMSEREEIRSKVRNRVSSLTEETATKKAYMLHRQPWDEQELEEEAERKEVAELRSEERIAQLRKVTEEMITSRREYLVSTRELAMRAIKEDEAAVAASRMSRKTKTIVQQEGTVAA